MPRPKSSGHTRKGKAGRSTGGRVKPLKNFKGAVAQTGKPWRKSAAKSSQGSERASDKREEKASARTRYTQPGNETHARRSKRNEEVDKERRGFFKSRKFDNKKAVKDFREKKTQPQGQSEKIRLNRFIANSGVCSRREADNLIAMGLISVNGKVITEMGYKVNPGDEVRYEDKVLRAEKPVYILLNKPKGYLTTTRDPQERNTVLHIIGNAVKERVYPVGRLDRNTTGLLLLTNDGDLAEKLSHPSYNVKKIYKVELDKPLTKADFQKILEGIPLEEGRAMVDDLAIVSPDAKTIGLELHIGWNRVVRRIFEALGYQVVKLDRTVYAGLDKKDLPRGEWRFLRPDEILRLKHFK
ncbi:MAG: rRNA pseudouridine synthase [Flammeovirgaceae bacterium]|nr:MAG: rRNA pseudouridine synthase [Flammeovirgaceae bacterium]